MNPVVEFVKNHRQNKQTHLISIYLGMVSIPILRVYGNPLSRLPSANTPCFEHCSIDIEFPGCHYKRMSQSFCTTVFLAWFNKCQESLCRNLCSCSFRKSLFQVIQFVTFLSPGWRSPRTFARVA